MTSSVFLHILSILILSCCIFYTYGLKCYGGKSVNGNINDTALVGPGIEQCKQGKQGNKTGVCTIKWTDNGANATFLIGCGSRPSGNGTCEKKLGDLPSRPPRAVGTAYCDTDLCNTLPFLKKFCKGSSGGGPGGPNGTLPNGTRSNSKLKG